MKKLLVAITIILSFTKVYAQEKKLFCIQSSETSPFVGVKYSEVDDSYLLELTYFGLDASTVVKKENINSPSDLSDVVITNATTEDGGKVVIINIAKFIGAKLQNTVLVCHESDRP